MPIPIQVGSLTDRLRNFLRIRGRVRLQLDETVVPTVQVQDLTKGPYLAGVQPCAGTFNQVKPIGPPTQFVIYLNPDGAIPPAANLTTDIRFIGRSFTLQSLSMTPRSAVQYRWRVGLVPRALMLGATIGATRQLISVQNGRGILDRVPVVIGSIVAIPFVIFGATSEFFQQSGGFDVASFSIPVDVPTLNPGTTITSEQVIVIEEVIGGVGVPDINVRGVYQSQPN